MKVTPLKDLAKLLQTLVESKLWLKVLIGMILGIGAGILLSSETGWVTPEHSQIITNWIALPGNLFIRLIQMIMIPLVVSSIIQGIAGGDDKELLKRTGPKVGLYFVSTTLAAIIIGVIVALLISPGNYIDAAGLLAAASDTIPEVVNQPATSSNIPQFITDLLPSNPLASMVMGEMLSIVIFAIVVGVALVTLPDSTAEPVVKLLFSIQEICITVTRWAMKIAPLAVFGLLCQVTAKVGIGAITGLAMYVLAVLVALSFLMLFYVSLLVIVAKTSVKNFFSSVRELLLLAFSMASSAAVMPLSLKTAEEKLGVKPHIARFIIPVGATINMDGTAVYQVVTTIFLAQMYGLELSFMSLLLIVVTTVAASIGTPSAPGAGVIVLGTVLSSVGIPITAIAVIIGVERLLGMFRTAVNVAGDMTACMVFHRISARKETEIQEITVAN